MKNKTIIILFGALTSSIEADFRSKTRKLLLCIGGTTLVKSSYNACSYIKELKEDICDFDQMRKDYANRRQKAVEELNYWNDNFSKISSFPVLTSSESVTKSLVRRSARFMQSVDEKYPWRVKDMLLNISDKRHEALRKSTFKKLHDINKFCGVRTGHQYFSTMYRKLLGFLDEKCQNISYKVPNNLNTSINGVKTSGLTWAFMGATALWCAKKLRK